MTDPDVLDPNCFYVAMAFDENDAPVENAGNLGGIRMYRNLQPAKAQRIRWVNGVRGTYSNRLSNHYPRSKVFQMTYVAGVLMSKEVDCD